MSAPRLGDQLCFQLYTASRLVVRAYQPVLDELGLTYPQYLVMLVLWERHDHGALPPSVGELGEALLLDSGTLTPLLKRLEEKGFVERHRSEADERRVHVRVTEAGLGLAEPAAQVPAALLCHLGVDPQTPGLVAEVAALREQLAAVVQALSR